jgi:hypothetical protein
MSLCIQVLVLSLFLCDVVSVGDGFDEVGSFVDLS